MRKNKTFDLNELSQFTGCDLTACEQIFAKMRFLPGSVLTFEISRPNRADHADCLQKARHLACSVTMRAA